VKDVFVIGVGMTRFAKQFDMSVKQLTALAVNEALADADTTARSVQAAYFANTVQGELEGQIMIRGQIALRPLGFEGIPIYNVENACASASTALNLAVTAIQAGACDVALAVGADKMASRDKAKSFAIFNGGWDVSDVENGKRILQALGAGMAPPADFTEMENRSFFMDVYAYVTRNHMRRYGTTQRQMAAVSAKNHQHSTANPLAQFTKALSVEEVMAAPGVVWPFTLPMCAPVSDGAAAAILCSEAGLGEFGRRRAVRVRASTMLTGVARTEDEPRRHICAIGAERAYAQAGVAPTDISVAELHDATAFAEIIQLENLQFCEVGAGGTLAERGETRIGGRIPVNTSGGLESKGHPIGATGLGQIYELVQQLRGESGSRQVRGARLAIAENGGGQYGIEEATASITILEKPHIATRSLS
jgi:acetyl-CoA acetyltransferase